MASGKSRRDTIRWLHLSDFHTGKDDYGQRKLFEKILNHVKEQVADGFVPDLIFVTGDVAYKGMHKQYMVFISEFLQPLYEIVGEERKSCTFFVPGNHDVIRETHKYLDREAACMAGSRFFDSTRQGRSERLQVLPRFRAYDKSSFLTPLKWINTPEGSYAKSVQFGETLVGIVGINTAWLSLDDNDQHKLSPGPNLIEDGLKKLGNCNLKIVLGHHPIGWFRDDHIPMIESILSSHQAFYLHGHRHKAHVSVERDGFLSAQSGAAFTTRDDEKWVNGLLWAELDLVRHVLRLQPRQWNPTNLDWPIGMDLPEKRKVLGADWWEFPFPHLEAQTYQKRIPPTYQEDVGFIGRNLVLCLA